MSKAIVYTITESGMDGRTPTTIIYATYFENIRDDLFNASKNKSYYHKGECIVDKEVAVKQALAKLNGIDRLMLEYNQREIK